MLAMLPIIATAYERKGDKGEAVRALEEYLKRAPSAPDHDVIERRIKNMKDQLARDQPAPPASASATTGAGSAAGPQTTPTGSAEATPAASSASLAVGAAAPPRAEGHGALPWVVVGVGGAAVVTGIVLFAVGAGDISSAEKQCQGRACTTTAAVNLGNNGRSLENLGGGVIGGGLAVAAAGIVWHFLEKTNDGAGAAPAEGTRVHPVVAPGYAGVALDHSF
jgi:hypothetical protein